MNDHDVTDERRERGNRLRAAREVRGIRSAAALAEILGPGFSRTKLARIESGARSLSPQDADYVAKHLTLPTSFFTAPANALGDVRAGQDAIAREVTANEETLAQVEALFGELDGRLDRKAAGGTPDHRPEDQGRRSGMQP